MNKLMEKHRTHWGDKSFLLSAFFGIVLLVVSLMLNYSAGTYATEKAGNAVADIFLDNLPVVNVGIIFVDGSILFGLLIIFLLIREPQQIPFILKSIAIFVIIRSIFITLTHIGPFPEEAALKTNYVLNKLTFGGDLFFSGHTGLPFLMTLIFWRNIYLRNVFLACSIIFAAITLLGHFHYSIDVFAAFFITYSIFHLAKWLFARDYRLFLNGIKSE